MKNREAVVENEKKREREREREREKISVYIHDIRKYLIF